MSFPTFQKLIESVPDERIAEVAKEAAKDAPRSIILAKYGSISLSSILEYLQMLSEYANFFEYSERESPNGRVITLYHKMGPKGSLFDLNYVKTLLEYVGYSPTITMGEHSVDFEILSNKIPKNMDF